MDLTRNDTELTAKLNSGPAMMSAGSLTGDSIYNVSGNRAAFLPTSSAGGDRIEADWLRSVASTALG